MIYSRVMYSGSRNYSLPFALSTLFITLVLLFASLVRADVATTSPNQIGYYCSPYTSSFVEGGYYESSGLGCAYIAGTVPKNLGYRYGDFYRGVVGSSTILNGHYLSFSDVSTQQNDIVGNPVQGEPLFSVIYEVRSGPAFNDVPGFRSFFTKGVPPPTNAYGFINWRWGVDPGPAACTEDCYSNVLFLPGIEASRLY